MQGGLVDEVGEIRADEPRCRARDDLEVDVGGQRHATGVHFQDGGAAATVGPVDDDAPVEAAGPEQGRIEDIGPVRGGDHHHGLALVEAVHLDEKLVEGLLPLVVAATETGAALATDGIELVDEDH